MDGSVNLHNSGQVALKMVAIGLLIGALGRHPYAYYIALRWAVCSVAAFSAVRAAGVGKPAWAWALATVAIAFNPIMPVHLTREIWAYVDVGVAAVLFVSILAIDRPVRPK